MIVFSLNLPIFFFSKSERKLESKHETLGALVICCLIRICCFLLFLFFVSLFSLSFSDTHLFFFLFLCFSSLDFVFFWYFLSGFFNFYVHFFLIYFGFFWFVIFFLLICNFIYLFNMGMRVNLNKLYFSSSHFSSQPSKRVFHSSIFLPSTKHHKTKTNISSIFHFFISSPFSILLLFNILNQVNLIVSSFRLYCQM